MKIDVAIIGAGIMGLAHAYHAVRAGLKVAVFEQNADAKGASIRNFGMLAIAAQAPGAELASAKRGLICWQDVAAKADIAMRPAGCLFLARAPQEMAVLEECAAAQNDIGHSFELKSHAQLADYAPNLRDNLLGGLWSPDAWKVDQRQALAKMTNWLREEHGVAFHFDTNVHELTPQKISTSKGQFHAEQIIHCGGDDFETLFANDFREAQVTRCQLQMLRTAPQPNAWQLQPFVLGGLSLPRYNVFETCPSLPALVDFQRQHFGDHVAAGIHLIACQEADGSVTIGDSHAYGDAADGQRSAAIDQLVLDELSALIDLPDPEIKEHWLGHYAKLAHIDKLDLAPATGVRSVTMTNGQGMTHSFAVAEDNIRDITGAQRTP